MKTGAMCRDGEYFQEDLFHKQDPELYHKPIEEFGLGIYAHNKVSK